jgi:hypothetical protein
MNRTLDTGVRLVDPSIVVHPAGVRGDRVSVVGHAADGVWRVPCCEGWIPQDVCPGITLKTPTNFRVSERHVWMRPDFYPAVTR